MSPRYSPDERSSLINLLAALRGGLEPSTGLGLYQGVQADQAARIDERQARLNSLTDLIVGAAGQGQSLDAVNALADAYTRGSNVPPRIEDVIGGLYPTETVTRQIPSGQYTPAAIQGGVTTPSEVGAEQLSPIPIMEEVTRQRQAQTSPLAPSQQPEPPLTTEQLLQQELLAGQVAEQRTAQASAPIVGQAIARQAVSQIGVLNPDTGQAITGADIIPLLLASPTYQALDPTTQAAAIETVQRLLRQAAEQRRQQAATSAAPEVSMGRPVPSGYQSPGRTGFPVG